MEEKDGLNNASIESIDTKDETQVLSSLLLVSELLSNTTDIDELLQLIVELAPKLTNSNICSIFLWDSKKKMFVPKIRHQRGGMDDVQLAGFYALRKTSDDVPQMARKLIKEKVPVVIEDASKTTLIPKELVELFDVKSALVVPLLCSDEFLGIMNINFTEKHHHFTQREIRIAMTLATHAALAIRNAQLISSLKEERNKADRIIAIMAEGLLVISPEKEIITTNNAMEKILELHAEEIVGMTCMDVFEGGIIQGDTNYCETHCPISTTSGEFVKCNIEGLVRVIGGEGTWLSLNYSPTVDIDGNLLYMVVTVRDMTERRRMKEEISRLNHKLLEDKINSDIEEEDYRGGM
jgi:PAS domain S-box-containing protein